MKIIEAIFFALITPFYLPPCEAVHTGKITIKRFRVTAYCPCKICCGKTDGITASGHKIRPGDRFAAADRTIPFGTILDIPGYGKVPVLDRGGVIRGDSLDVFFDTHRQALNWGIKYLDVAIYEN